SVRPAGGGVGAGAVSGVDPVSSGAAAGALGTVCAGGGGNSRFEISDHPRRMTMDSAKAATNRFSMKDLLAQSRGVDAGAAAAGTGSNPPARHMVERKV